MTVNREKLKAIHASGFNCAQSVAVYFAERAGIDEKTALAATGGFGGGFRSGGVCGAVSAAIMLLGLTNAFDDSENFGAKEEIFSKTVQFNDAFAKRYGGLDCREIKGRNGISCDEYIAGAAEILEEMLAK